MNSFFETGYTIDQLHEAYARRAVSVTDVMRQFFDYARIHDASIGAFLELFEQEGMARAATLDAEQERRDASSPLPPLFGVPVAIKDNMLYARHHASAASKILEHHISAYTGTAVQKLLDAGAVIIGRTNLDEFAMGSSTEYSAFGVTRNPYDPEKVPGGSSGGSAAAVAGNMVLASLGSDTGGSIRQPAGLCGVVGLKPTYGAVSRYGLMALASSLDQIGPLAKTVRDAARVFSVITGQDPLDATSAPATYENLFINRAAVKKKVLGVPREYFIDGMDADVAVAVRGVIDRFVKDGFVIKEISLPHTQYALSCYYIILPAEASSNLARFDGVRYSRLTDVPVDAGLLDVYRLQKGMGYGDEPTRRILLGTFVLSSGYYDAYYAKAQKVRRLILDDFQKAFDDGVDAMLTPVTPTTAFRIGEKKDNPLSMYLSDIFTIPVNLAGLPALSLPVGSGFSKTNMPINFQIIGKHFDERTILSLGDYYEAHLKPTA
ncbi:MAG: Asp-tRNA(Asn)/Glu-tRNA(Gln) amidotransferase subunit GatA [Candidatus Paceibacterota bacterium]|jgi:aspartyl-tRNA(Asn)/glutamyl-tRNA(Gln) amidotransferase subunit A